MNLIYAVIDDLKDCINEEMRDLVKYSLRPSWTPINLNFFSYLETDNWDELLNLAANQISANAVFIQSAYHLILNTTRFHQEAIQLLQSSKFIASGHIADGNALFSHNNPNTKNERNRYYGFHKQCLLVNLDVYRDLGKPKFGSPTETVQSLYSPIRSKENLHDTYTPTHLNPSELTENYKPSEFGWNFINESIKNKLVTPAFDPSLRSTKVYLYPKKDPDWFMDQIHKIQNRIKIDIFNQINGQTTFLNILNTAVQTKDDVNYIYNNEPFIDVASIANQNFHTFVTLCSGFKINTIMFATGFDEKTEVIHYDISTKAIDFQKFLIENWNGLDLDNFINSDEKYKCRNMRYDPSKKDQVLQFFGGENQFKNHWERYKNLNHTFIKLDIINEYQNLDKYLNGNVLLWYSNCYAYKATYLQEGGSKSIRKKYMTMLEWMNQKNENIWLNGNIADTNILANGLCKDVLLKTKKVFE